MLDGTAEKKALVRSVFSSIVATPAQTFGTVTSNLPRVRQSELLTPAELMVILHDSGRDIGLKSAIECVLPMFVDIAPSVLTLLQPSGFASP